MSYQEPAAGGREPTEEELRAAMEEQMRRIRVQDVLLQTVATLVNLGGRRLGLAPEAEDERDLEQARLAIDGVRSLTPLLGAEEAQAVKEALSQLQVAYAREAQRPQSEGAPAGAGAAGGESESPTGSGDAPPGSPGEGPPTQGRPVPDEADRAKARSKIWTPPGS